MTTQNDQSPPAAIPDTPQPTDHAASHVVFADAEQASPVAASRLALRREASPPGQGHVRTLLLAVVGSSAVLLFVLVIALVVVLGQDPSPGSAVANTPGASTAALTLTPQGQVAIGDLVTVQVVVVSAYSFRQVSILVDGAEVVSSIDPSSKLSFRAATVGDHQVVSVVRMSAGDEIRSSPVALNVRSGATS